MQTCISKQLNITIISLHINNQTQKRQKIKPLLKHSIYIIWRIFPIMWKFTMLPFQACPMSKKLAKYPETTIIIIKKKKPTKSWSIELIRTPKTITKKKRNKKQNPIFHLIASSYYHSTKYVRINHIKTKAQSW